MVKINCAEHNEKWMICKHRLNLLEENTIPDGGVAPRHLLRLDWVTRKDLTGKKKYKGFLEGGWSGVCSAGRPSRRRREGRTAYARPSSLKKTFTFFSVLLNLFLLLNLILTSGAVLHLHLGWYYFDKLSTIVLIFLQIHSFKKTVADSQKHSVIF